MKKIQRFFKFSLSSIISFIVDYTVFSVLSLFLSNISLCNILARIFSGTMNYLLNRNYVFENKKSIYKTSLYYLILAFVIIILNTIFLNITVYIFLINKFLAKIMVEIILFVFNYFIQKKIIFKKE